MTHKYKKAVKRDANEPEIVKALRDAGASVFLCDFCDLVVGYKGKTFLFEVKNPETEKSYPKVVRLSQIKMQEAWEGGPWKVVKSADQALEIINRGYQPDVED